MRDIFVQLTGNLQMRIDQGLAESSLEHGALGIGENHEAREGRDLAIELIDSGKVKMLMVELSEGAYDPTIKVATNEKNKGIEFVKTCLSSLSARHASPVSLGTVIAQAIINDIPVYNVDHYIANAAARIAGSTANMKKRNAYAALRFKTLTGSQIATGAGAGGCLILFGGAHFEGKDALDAPEYIANLPVVMMG